MNNTGVVYDLQGHLLFRRFITTAFRRGNVPRGKVVGFSVRSSARMRRYLRTSTAEYRVMVTLTYPYAYPLSGITAKAHLASFLRSAKLVHEPDGRKFSAFWFLEFQKRGAPHFHIFLTHRIAKEFVARRWFEVVGSDDSRHLAAGTRTESLRSGRYGVCAYATKYACKQNQKEVPPNFQNCGRFWGVVGERSTQAATIVFGAELGENGRNRHSVMVEQLKNILKGRAKVVPMTSSLTKCFRISEPGVINSVKALFARTAAVLNSDANVFFEMPEFGMGIEEG